MKRAYFKSIENYSSKSLMTIFDAHIAQTATVYTDQWTGYHPIKEPYSIEAEKSNKRESMKQMHVIIHQVKSWIRSTYSWVHKQHIQKYLDEYSFRINRSIYKQTILHKLIQRMIVANPTYYQQIKLSN